MSKRLGLRNAVGVGAAVAMLFCAPGMLAQAKGDLAAEKATSIAEKTKSMEKKAGYFNIYWDAKAGKLWLEVDTWGTEFLYQSSLPAGIGSNDIGLDRGQMGETRIVRVERRGPKVRLVQENFNFSAGGYDKTEKPPHPTSFRAS